MNAFNCVKHVENFTHVNFFVLTGQVNVIKFAALVYSNTVVQC